MGNFLLLCRIVNLGVPVQYTCPNIPQYTFPFRYLNGENKVNITIEQRYFYHWYPLKTFQFASAVFIDSGVAWDNNFSANQVTNVGVGLRLVPTRTSSGKVLHLDLAFPIDDRDVVGSWQFQLRTKKTF